MTSRTLGLLALAAVLAAGCDRTPPSTDKDTSDTSSETDDTQPTDSPDETDETDETDLVDETDDTGMGTDTDYTGPGTLTTLVAVRDGSGGFQVDDLVAIRGLVVTALDDRGFTVQEPGATAYAGIYVFQNAVPTDSAGNPLAVGDIVDVVGEYEEYDNQTSTPAAGIEDTLAELIVLPSITDSSITKVGPGVGVPAITITPAPVTLADLATSTAAEPYESMLVRLDETNPLEVLTPADSGSFFEFTVGAAGRPDTVVVDNEFHRLYLLTDFMVGSTFDAIQGVVFYSFDRHKLAPREDADGIGFVSGGDTGMVSTGDTMDTADTADTGTTADQVLADLAPGDLRVTEVIPSVDSCSDSDGEYIEVWNATAASVELRGLELSDSGTTYTFNQSYVLAADARVLFARNVAGLQTCLGLTGIGGHGFGLNDSGDSVTLAAGGVTFDSYTWVGADVTAGFARELSDNDLTTWCDADPADTIGTADHGTPGAINGDCPGTGGPTGDTMDTADTDTGDTDTADTDTGDTDLPGPLDGAVGLLLVNEFMANPDDCSDDDGEYIEVRWTGSTTLPLDGLTIEDSGNTWTYSGTATLAPGDRAFFARDAAALATCYAGLTAIDEYGFGLSNSGDEVTLLTAPSASGGTVIDQRVFGSGDVQAGISTERDETDPAIWCFADTVIPTTGATDLGTPGDDNGPCPAPTGMTGDTADTDDSDDTDDTDDTGAHTDETAVDTDTALPTFTLADAVGDLRISEIMANPADCPDPGGEYFEIAWFGTGLLPLDGLEMADNSASFTYTGPIVLMPGERLTVANSIASMYGCYGFTADLESGFALANSGDQITLSYGGGTLIDQRIYGSTDVASGASSELDDVDRTTWCFATDVIVGDGSTTPTDLGTPSASNGTCGSTGPTGDTSDTSDTAVSAVTDIPALRGGAFTVGDSVTLDGVIVTAVGAGGFVVQDPTAGAYGGIYVFDGFAGTKPAVGDAVDVTGEYLEYSGSGGTAPLGTLAEIVIASGGSFSVVSSGNPLPAPIPLTVADVQAAGDAEPYEGMLVTLDDAGDYTFASEAFGEWTFDDGTDSFILDNEFHDIATDYTVDAGDTFDAVTGVLHFTFSAYKVAVRDATDVVGFSDVP